MFFSAMIAILLVPALIPEIDHNSNPNVIPTPAGYTLPFTPIVNDPNSPVGNLTIQNANFIEGIKIPLGNVSSIWFNGTFNQTTAFASYNTSTVTGDSRQAKISISWYEYMEIFKTDPNWIASPWFNYSSRVPLASLISVEYNSTIGWGTLVTAPSSFYAYAFVGSTFNSNFLNFSLGAMNPAFISNTTNATVLTRVKYSYQIPISSWQVLENSTSIAVPNLINSFNQTYYETFRIDDPTLVAAGSSLLNMTLAYVPFYGANVKFLSLWNASVEVPPSKFKITLPANNMTFVSNASADYKIYFNASFTIQFDQPVNPPYNYAVDRLASDNDVREHWYYVKVTEGPDLLRIAQLEFNDTTIAYEDTIGTSTYFGRPLARNWNNYTVTVDENTNTINNGTNLKGGYFVNGETDVLMLSYDATHNLTIAILDQIYTPIEGAEVTLYRDGIPFGSYTSAVLNYSMPAKLSDASGLVVFTNLPSEIQSGIAGNYTIHVAYGGNDYGFYAVDINKTNDLKTLIPHFPTWLIIWGSFSLVVTFYGFAKYKRYKNVPLEETR